MRTLSKSFCIAIIFSLNFSFSTMAEVKDASPQKKYSFPSIMVERDMDYTYINDTEKPDILTSLIIKGWKISADSRGIFLCKYVSPEMTYTELQETLNFHDEDVTVNSDQKPAKTSAAINEKWLSCNYLEYSVSLLDYLPGRKSKIVKLEQFEPDSVIATEWLTCYIKYTGKMYDGKDKSVKLKAVVINNKVQAAANEHAEYNKNKSFIRKMLDFFEFSPH